MPENSNGPGKQRPAGEGGNRLPYEPPRILYREPLEIIAAVCTDVDSKPDSISCPFGTPQS